MKKYRTESDLWMLYLEWKDKLDKIGIYTHPVTDVRINKRLRSPYARALYHRLEKTGEIEFNPITMSAYDSQIENTMIHELLHLAIGCENVGHTGKWKEYARKVNNVYEYEINATASYETMGIDVSKIHYKYEVYCPNCGYTWRYNRMNKTVKNPHNYFHKGCSDHLERRCV